MRVRTPRPCLVQSGPERLPGTKREGLFYPENTKIPPPAIRTPLPRVQKAEAASSEGGSLRKGEVLTDERLSARSLAMGRAGDLWGVLFPSSYLFFFFLFSFFQKQKTLERQFALII